MVESVRGIVQPIRIGTWCKAGSKTKVRSGGWRFATAKVIVFKKGNPIVRTSDVLDYIVCPTLKTGRRAQLPKEVTEWMLEPYAIPGGTFLDPFAGSGALLLAAESKGMKAQGFEIQKTEH